MKLIITEKPSVAQDIAAAIGNSQRANGYIVTEEYEIVWAFGHLLEIDNSIIPRERDLDKLPIFPREFTYTIIPEKKKQYEVVKELIKKTSCIIIATDAEREGELIARLILNHLGWRNWQNTYRFWTSEALTKDVIRKTLNNLIPATHYDGKYFAALSRQHADWLTGINLSRAVSIKANGNWTCGRVQTPVLALIVRRDTEIGKFKKEAYYLIKAKHEAQGIPFESFYQLKEEEQISEEEDGDNTAQDAQGSRLSKENALKLTQVLSAQKNGTIGAIIKSDKREVARSLHSLTSLQREANQLYGYSAQKTLDTAQALYEKYKCLSYPRSDSNYLAESSRQLVKEIMLRLSLSELIEYIDKVETRVFDNSKLTDHHAIIPLHILPDECTEAEKNIFNLVFRRFKGVFMEDYQYQTTQIKIKIGACDFIAMGKKEIRKGWKILYQEKEQKKMLPALTEKSIIPVLNILMEERFTSPPPFYNDSAIVGKMKVLGLGTTATRASIIEKLLSTSYLMRDKKNLISTDKGKELIRVLSDSKLTNAEFTAEWENKLESIQVDNTQINGYNSFINGIKLFVGDELNKVKNSDIKTINQATPSMLALANKLSKEKKLKNPDTTFEGTKAFIDLAMKTVLEIGKCSCGKTITDSKKAYNCPCGKVVWKEIAGKKISPKQAAILMQGKKIAMKGLKKREGQGTYDASIYLKSDGKIGFDFN
jgi:DNA topoisomerase-3